MPSTQSPPHPGEVLREYLGDASIAEAARKPGVSRTTLSRILQGTSGISADMAIRLGLALGTSAQMWMGLQSAFDLFQASKRPRPKVGRIGTAVKDMLHPSADMKHSTEEFAWDNVVPVGREFGSPDYERLEELDNLAYKAFGSMQKARRWLDAPHSDLGGKTPEMIAKTKSGFGRVKRLLREKLRG